MTNKYIIAINVLTLIDGKNVFADEFIKFQRHLIVEKSCANKPNKIESTLGPLNDSVVIDRIIESYPNHLSVLKIKN